MNHGFSIEMQIIYGPRRDKTCLRGFQQSEAQTSLLSYRDKLEIRNFACCKLNCDTFHAVNNKGADQSARMFANPEDRFYCVEAHIKIYFVPNDDCAKVYRFS